MIPQLATLARVTRIGCWRGGRWVFCTLGDTTWGIWRHIMFFIFFYVVALGNNSLWLDGFLYLCEIQQQLCRFENAALRWHLGMYRVKCHFWVNYPFKELYFRQMNSFPLFSTDELKSTKWMHLYKTLHIFWEIYTGQISADSSSAWQHEFPIIIHSSFNKIC